MTTANNQEQRRVRAFLIAPEQFLRCVQLLADGGTLQGEPFPPGVSIVSAYPTALNQNPVFAIVLEHNTFDPVSVVNNNGVLTGASSQIPPIIFQLDEQMAMSSPPVMKADLTAPVATPGTAITHESRHLINYQVLPYQIIRLFSLLAAGAPATAPTFPSGMTLLHSGVGNDGAFSIICEHSSFNPVSVDIRRTNGYIVEIGGIIPQVMLGLGDAT